ncbi:phosphotransferase [Demequina sp. NBRC 110057]|uniref:phosphotransferase n=1 Tax=Demequina sp. NBRC 110057 TaxID=1570346 RepID=UPI000A021AEA|nr:phosphotransferase [Demequina sp. NBRC 110057]
MPTYSDAEPLYIPDEMVRALIDEQCPDLAEFELGRRYTLEDHFAIRIGDEHGAIFSRLPGYDSLFARVTDVIAQQSAGWSFPSSLPVRTGRPGHGYPWHWVVVNWISASTAGFVPLHQPAARAVGAALREIHRPAPAGSPLNPRSGVGLRAWRGEFEQMLAHAVAHGAPENRELDADATRAIFERGCTAPIDTEPAWTHGRLEPRAIMSDQGAFAGLLLWTNFGAGDIAQDIGFVGTVLGADMREDFFAAYGDISDATVARALAYLVYAALRYIEVDDPFLLRMAWERLIELGVVHEA